jgi:hypothetical protein
MNKFIYDIEAVEDHYSYDGTSSRDKAIPTHGSSVLYKSLSHGSAGRQTIQEQVTSHLHEILRGGKSVTHTMSRTHSKSINTRQESKRKRKAPNSALLYARRPLYKQTRSAPTSEMTVPRPKMLIS